MTVCTPWRFPFGLTADHTQLRIIVVWFLWFCFFCWVTVMSHSHDQWNLVVKPHCNSRAIIPQAVAVCFGLKSQAIVASDFCVPFFYHALPTYPPNCYWVRCVLPIFCAPSCCSKFTQPHRSHSALISGPWPPQGPRASAKCPLPRETLEAKIPSDRPSADSMPVSSKVCFDVNPGLVTGITKSCKV